MNSKSDYLFNIEDLVKKIINTKNEVLYEITNEKNGIKWAIISSLAEAIYLMVKNDVYNILQEFSIHEFNPYIKVFIDNIRDSDIYDSIKRYDAVKLNGDYFLDDYVYNIFLEMMTQIQAFIDRIKRDVQTEDFKKIIYNANRAKEKNLIGLYQYIDSLFDHYSRLLVIRLDLGYHSGNIITSRSDIDKKYFQAKNDFKRFLDNLEKHRLFKYKVGHVWKLEYGPEKGFHIHLMLFYDGSKVRQDVTLGKMLGNYWVDSVPYNQGLYFNCNANKLDYPKCGIGMIHFGDAEMRNNLKNAAAYLVKVDHYARMLTPDNSRTFGRGEILPPKVDGRGRPRSDD